MKLDIKGKSYQLPIFMPDATHASIKGVDSVTLTEAEVKGLVVNTYHLLCDNIIDTIEHFGGVKAFMQFQGLIITDSGGFQAMSLVRRNKSNGKFHEDGVDFKQEGSGATLRLTPEICISTQIRIGSDIIMVLDDCTDPNEPLSEQVISVDRTIRWAKRCKDEYDRVLKDIPKSKRPLIFGIVQGGNSHELRKKCAEGLIDINFDGYAYGGWPMQHGKLMADILAYTESIMPDDKPRYAMGVGKPSDIIACAQMGYNMFDCVIPTRDARHGRLYVSGGLKTINISNEIFAKDYSPIEDGCKCYTCENFSKAYLRHLYRVGETVFYKLASIHNLWVFNGVISNLNMSS